jgi:putative ATPase
MKKEPLAHRMRPNQLSDFVGQEEILGEGKLLHRMITEGNVSSIILFGPAGTGKTSIARIISKSVNLPFQRINAVSAGISDIKKVVEDTQNFFLNPSLKTVLFIDEIHRLNKVQQDVLLPYVEDGTIVLIGATTQNPFYEVNKALISRTSVWMLKPLSKENILILLRKALTDKENGLGEYQILAEEKALLWIAQMSNGDARVAFNTLEMAVMTTKPSKEGRIVLSDSVVQNCMQKKSIPYDKNADEHYDTISAFIKSMRGSDPNAAVFYLAKALSAGEDPLFLARRMMICAAEDVGLADPSQLALAVSAYKAVHVVGMPEARIILAEAAIGIATSPKSNACYVAINQALGDVKEKHTGEVPMHLRNSPIDNMKALGYGEGYLYPHDFEGNEVLQDYLPKEILGTVYYKPTQNGKEKEISERMKKFPSKTE